MVKLPPPVAVRKGNNTDPIPTYPEGDGFRICDIVEMFHRRGDALCLWGAAAQLCADGRHSKELSGIFNEAIAPKIQP